MSYNSHPSIVDVVISYSRVRPPAEVLKVLRQIVVVHGSKHLDVIGDQLVYQLVVVSDAVGTYFTGNYGD